MIDRAFGAFNETKSAEFAKLTIRAAAELEYLERVEGANSTRLEAHSAADANYYGQLLNQWVGVSGNLASSTPSPWASYEAATAVAQ